MSFVTHTYASEASAIFGVCRDHRAQAGQGTHRSLCSILEHRSTGARTGAICKNLCTHVVVIVVVVVVVIRSPHKYFFFVAVYRAISASVDRGDACLTSPRSFGFFLPPTHTPVSKRRRQIHFAGAQRGGFARRHSSGLAYRFCQVFDSSSHPSPTNKYQVHRNSTPYFVLSTIVLLQLKRNKIRKARDVGIR